MDKPRLGNRIGVMMLVEGNLMVPREMTESNVSMTVSCLHINIPLHSPPLLTAEMSVCHLS